METIHPQSVTDIAEVKEDSTLLSAEQLKALAGVTRFQLLEDIGQSMKKSDLEDERF